MITPSEGTKKSMVSTVNNNDKKKVQLQRTQMQSTNYGAKYDSDSIQNWSN